MWWGDNIFPVNVSPGKINNEHVGKVGKTLENSKITLSRAQEGRKLERCFFLTYLNFHTSKTVFNCYFLHFLFLKNFLLTRSILIFSSICCIPSLNHCFARVCPDFNFHIFKFHLLPSSSPWQGKENNRKFMYIVHIHMSKMYVFFVHIHIIHIDMY